MIPSKMMIFFVIQIIFVLLVKGERTKDKMYERIDGSAACFRRLNSTHQTGCTSNRPGSTGVIHMVNQLSDLEFIFNTGTADPYMAVMPVTMLTPEVLAMVSSHPDKISGLIVHKNVTTPQQYSSEAKCPNQYYGMKDSCDVNDQPWNPHGTGVLQGNYPFPIFLISDLKNLEKITDCFRKFNDYDMENQNLRSLCALELSSFMFAAVNSQTCIRRSQSSATFTSSHYCDPLGDRNVWSTLFPWSGKALPGGERVEDVVLVTARMDTTSMFHEVTPGAVSPLTGLVTLMSTARLLSRMVAENDKYKKNVFFVIFNGESYDYIGSQRFVYDITNGKFPMEIDENIKNPVPQLKLENISLIIELGQLNRKSKLFTHNVIYNPGSTEVDKFKQLLSRYSKDFNLNILDSKTGKLPPSSLQSFLVENENISGLVLTDHDRQFTNQYYNSLYDDKSQLGYNYLNLTGDDDTVPDDSIQRYVVNVTNVLARSLYEVVMEEAYQPSGKKEEADVKIVDELFHCYLDTANCKIHKATTLKEHIDEKPLSLYVSVIASSNIVTALTGLSLAWLTGTTVKLLEPNCTGDAHNPVYQYFWMSSDIDDMNATACYQTTMNFTLAVSPAFEINDYEWDSGRYSTWTESVWKDFNVRMYLRPSSRHELMTISVGTVTLVLSMALVYFVKTRSDLLFPKPVATGPGTSC